MTLLAAVLMLSKVVFSLFLIAVVGLFLFALISEMIERFRNHNRKAARIAAQVPPAPSISEGWMGTGFGSQVAALAAFLICGRRWPRQLLRRFASVGDTLLSRSRSRMFAAVEHRSCPRRGFSFELGTIQSAWEFCF
jgi:hypothetical protein